MGLHDIQTTVHVGKDKRNEFGKYNYRTAEGILSALKAGLPEGWSVTCSDELQEFAGQIFVSARASLWDENGKEMAHACGHAMHPLEKKGMDPSQITGAASSYARKYALSGLLALDDGSVDPDATNQHKSRSAASEGLQDAEEQAILDGLPEDPSEEAIANAYADRIEQKALGYKTKAGVSGYMKSEQVKGWMDFISRVDDTLRQGVRQKVFEHLEGLEK